MPLTSRQKTVKPFESTKDVATSWFSVKNDQPKEEPAKEDLQYMKRDI